MWPVLTSSLDVLRDFLASDAHTLGNALPGGSFTATMGFWELQTDGGPLTHEFEIGGIRSRRMVVPYQVWMLQRIEAVLARCASTPAGRVSIEDWLGGFERGHELLALSERLEGARVVKEGGRLRSAA